jgi:hypothetical protein
VGAANVSVPNGTATHFFYSSLIFIYSYFDESVLTFLRESNRDNLLTNIAVDLDHIHHYNPDALVPLMATLVPSLTTSIKSISICDTMDLVRTEYSELAKPMMVATRVLYTRFF